MTDAGRHRGLGRGLSALLGDPFAAGDLARPAAPAATQPTYGAQPAPTPTPTPAPSPAAGPNVVPIPLPVAPPAAEAEPAPREIAISAIDRNPNQPRRHFDETELGELAASIRAHGVLQPILVRPIAGQAGRYEIVAGERRWRASQLAGNTHIPAVVREFADNDVLEIAIVENVQRSDLNPIEEALGYQALMARFGRTQADVAEKVGKSRPHVANMLRLLQLPGEIQEMVREGKLSAGHARAILSAPDPMELARLAIAQALSVRDVERMAAKAKEAAEPPMADAPVVASAPSAVGDPDVAALEARLSAALGMEVKIQPRGPSAGEVRILYATVQQLDALLARLTT